MALLPLADASRSWDAGAARKRLATWAGGSRSKYARAFLYEDPSGDKSKLVAGDFKFPIADVINGTLTAIPRAIMAAAGVIQGARGGANISDAAKSSIKSRLAAYYSKMGKTPPWSASAESSSGEEAPGMVGLADDDGSGDDDLVAEGIVESTLAVPTGGLTITTASGPIYYSTTASTTTSVPPIVLPKLGVDAEVAEVTTGSSMGGHSPKADIDPERKLVRSFGTWAKGKQSVCVRVLSTHHPELCTHRPGGCNALCAWMKDQFLGTTKWRKGSKESRSLSGEVLVSESGIFIDYGDGPEDFISGPLAIDIIAESEARDPEADAVSRPDWATDEVLQSLADALDLESEPDAEVVVAAEADIAFEKVTTRLRKLLRDRGQKKVAEALGKDYGYCYITIKETHPDHVIYESDEERVGDSGGYESRMLYRQNYKVDESLGDVVLDGLPTKVEIQYVPTKSDTEATEPDPYDTAYYSGEEAPAVATEASGLAKLGSWQKTSGVSVFVRKTDGKVIMGPKKFRGKKFSDISGSTAAESTASHGDDHIYVDVETPKGNVTVKMRKSDGLITSGPRSLKGSHLPPIPDDLATTTDAGEAGVSESAVAEYDVNEIFTLDHAVVESAATTAGGGKPKTPSGREVDAIIRIITPGPGNTRDGFFYPSEAISATHKVFEGLKMYSDHLSDDEERKLGGRPRSLRDWVSTVKETWVDGEGRAFGGADFVDEAFESKAKKGKDDIGVSVRAGVKARPGRVNGRPYKVVEGFTTGRSVDWVTEAGARGGLEEIAESAKNDTEGVAAVADKAIGEMTLDELQAARPDLLAEYAERVESVDDDDSSSSSGDDSGEQGAESSDDESGLTEDRIRQIVEGAVTSALQAERDRSRQRDKITNRERLDGMLAGESSFREATKLDLRRELADVTFDDEVGESGEIAKTGTQRFEEHVKARIDERKKELAEYTGVTEVIDTGVTGTSVAESQTRFQPGAGSVHEGIERSLGLVPAPQEPAQDTAAA